LIIFENDYRNELFSNYWRNYSLWSSYPYGHNTQVYPVFSNLKNYLICNFTLYFLTVTYQYHFHHQFPDSSQKDASIAAFFKAIVRICAIEPPRCNLCVANCVSRIVELPFLSQRHGERYPLILYTRRYRTLAAVGWTSLDYNNPFTKRLLVHLQRTVIVNNNAELGNTRRVTDDKRDGDEK